MAYRLYVRSENQIVARVDFNASDDDDTVAVANFICGLVDGKDAVCEVWRGANCLYQTSTRQAMRWESLSRERQDVVLRTEEALVNSHWAISKSKALLAAVQASARRP